MEKIEMRELLNLEDQFIFDQIENHELLGATNHIAAIGVMMEHLAMDQEKSLEEIKTAIKKLAKYYINTRGKASQAITSAILLMIQGIEAQKTAQGIIDTKNQYFVDTEKNKEKLLSYAVNLSKKYTTIMCYDYSSTVENFLKALAKDQQMRTIYIPESRVINGGKPYIEPLVALNYQIKFIPDCAIFYYMDECEACFMGAETFYPDGTGFNTLGSDLVGLVCDYFHKPLYFITPMIKLDGKAQFGIEKKLVIDDLEHKMTKEWAENSYQEKIDFKVPELIGVESRFIHSFITEYGVVPAKQMYSVAKEYMESIYGGVSLDE
ncbi:IF-2B domain-containing protein [Isobaculum melis]|uniref:Ribose 1,5-bisphosphate isomerase n=1 Tax=Isobaculum melis TaxID=142588 RepID=A0A1H9T1B9_9LACT|nr:hypothetical protein [Isobaculum melis]SER91062.1 ribose 1,5-bisphosphate isomerase [Isobaculum melis]